MKGQQTIEISNASVTEAIEQYLNRHFVHPLKVLEVLLDRSRNGYGNETFTLQVKFEQIEAPVPCSHLGDMGESCALSEGHPGPHGFCR